MFPSNQNSNPGYSRKPSASEALEAYLQMNSSNHSVSGGHSVSQTSTPRSYLSSNHSVANCFASHPPQVPLPNQNTFIGSANHSAVSGSGPLNYSQMSSTSTILSTLDKLKNMLNTPAYSPQLNMLPTFVPDYSLTQVSYAAPHSTQVPYINGPTNNMQDSRLVQKVSTDLNEEKFDHNSNNDRASRKSVRKTESGSQEVAVSPLDIIKYADGPSTSGLVRRSSLTRPQRPPRDLSYLDGPGNRRRSKSLSSAKSRKPELVATAVPTSTPRNVSWDTDTAPAAYVQESRLAALEARFNFIESEQQQTAKPPTGKLSRSKSARVTPRQSDDSTNTKVTYHSSLPKFSQDSESIASFKCSTCVPKPIRRRTKNTASKAAQLKDSQLNVESNASSSATNEKASNVDFTSKPLLAHILDSDRSNLGDNNNIMSMRKESSTDNQSAKTSTSDDIIRTDTSYASYPFADKYDLIPSTSPYTKDVSPTDVNAFEGNQQHINTLSTASAHQLPRMPSPRASFDVNTLPTSSGYQSSLTPSPRVSTVPVLVEPLALFPPVSSNQAANTGIHYKPIQQMPGMAGFKPVVSVANDTFMSAFDHVPLRCSTPRDITVPASRPEPTRSRVSGSSMTEFQSLRILSDSLQGSSSFGKENPSSSQSSSLSSRSIPPLSSLAENGQKPIDSLKSLIRNMNEVTSATNKLADQSTYSDDEQLPTTTVAALRSSNRTNTSVENGSIAEDSIITRSTLDALALVEQGSSNFETQFSSHFSNFQGSTSSPFSQ